MKMPLSSFASFLGPRWQATVLPGASAPRRCFLGFRGPSLFGSGECGLVLLVLRQALGLCSLLELLPARSHAQLLQEAISTAAILYVRECGYANDTHQGTAQVQ